ESDPLSRLQAHSSGSELPYQRLPAVGGVSDPELAQNLGCAGLCRPESSPFELVPGVPLQRMFLKHALEVSGGHMVDVEQLLLPSTNLRLLLFFGLTQG